jgi:hypothetical protein
LPAETVLRLSNRRHGEGLSHRLFILEEVENYQLTEIVHQRKLSLPQVGAQASFELLLLPRHNVLQFDKWSQFVQKSLRGLLEQYPRLHSTAEWFANSS